MYIIWLHSVPAGYNKQTPWQKSDFKSLVRCGRRRGGGWRGLKPRNQVSELCACCTAGDEEGEEGGAPRTTRRARGGGGELNPSATLEASVDAINVKKFDLAFSVDPLFHKTSAQFDEGGAKGAFFEFKISKSHC